jgi:hypothetical protein
VKFIQPRFSTDLGRKLLSSFNAAVLGLPVHLEQSKLPKGS